MTINIAINGFGRIGRLVARALYESNHYRGAIRIVAINDASSPEQMAHLFRYDSVHGRLPFEVSSSHNHLVIDGDEVACLSVMNPAELPWRQMGIDVVLECTGLFCKREAAAKHLEAGAKRVLISAPANDADRTVVFGVNHQSLTAEDRIVSNASCTTNALATLIKPLQDAIGIEAGLMTTVHAMTNDQRVADSMHQDPRRARASSVSMMPTKTGAAAAIGLVIPELQGKLDGVAVRVPTVNVSLVDVTLTMARDTSFDEISQALIQASESDLRGILVVNHEPLVSIDFNHHPASSICDIQETRSMGTRLFKLFSWYDNEWGFSNRMLDVINHMAKV